MPALGMLAVDFDETITLRDTIYRLPELAADHLPQGDREAMLLHWKDAAEEYYADWRRTLSRALESVEPTSDPRDALARFAAAFDGLERTSLDAVEASGLLRGIPRSALRHAGGDIDQWDGALDVLRDAAERGAELHVVAANWSAELIEAAVGSVDPVIHSSDLVFGADDRSTGGLVRRMVSALDKRACLRRLRARDGWTVYIGDSVTDLLALLEADVGILIGGNRQAQQVCEHFGVPLEPLDREPLGTPPAGILAAASWSEIRCALLGA